MDGLFFDPKSPDSNKLSLKPTELYALLIKHSSQQALTAHLQCWPKARTSAVALQLVIKTTRRWLHSCAPDTHTPTPLLYSPDAVTHIPSLSHDHVERRTTAVAWDTPISHADRPSDHRPAGGHDFTSTPSAPAPAPAAAAAPAAVTTAVAVIVPDAGSLFRLDLRH